MVIFFFCRLEVGGSWLRMKQASFTYRALVQKRATSFLQRQPPHTHTSNKHCPGIVVASHALRRKTSRSSRRPSMRSWALHNSALFSLPLRVSLLKDIFDNLDLTLSLDFGHFDTSGRATCPGPRRSSTTGRHCEWLRFANPGGRASSAEFVTAATAAALVVPPAVKEMQLHQNSLRVQVSSRHCLTIPGGRASDDTAISDSVVAPCYSIPGGQSFPASCTLRSQGAELYQQTLRLL